MPKVFIIGLPRTGTTSVAKAFLDLGYTTAHCAYTQAAIQSAQVIADTPAYAHYAELDQQYPNSKFILLTRDEERWLKSISVLLQAMKPGLLDNKPLFEPLVKRCFEQVFKPLNAETLLDAKHLTYCYQRHTAQVNNYFANKADQLLVIDIAAHDFYQQIGQFLEIDTTSQHILPHLNQAGCIKDWKHIDHHLKINAKLKTPRVF